MDYVEVKITVEPFNQNALEVLTAYLSEIGFDSFTSNHQELLAYIPASIFSSRELKDTLALPPMDKLRVDYTSTEIPDQNWNRRWEENFSPISIGSFCYVRAPFHPPDKQYGMEVVIEPRMAFGTGHHHTTWLMANTLFSIPVKGKRLLDIGCGTGILAIIACKLGAEEVTAIDNDNWAYQNTIDNAEANGCSGIKAYLGDAQLIEGQTFDTILANINLNVLTSDMPSYHSSLNRNGLLIMSGFYTSDVEALHTVALSLGLQKESMDEREDWIVITYKKIRQ